MNTTAKENIAKLPEWCYSVLLTNRSLIIIKGGESGYHETSQPFRAIIQEVGKANNISELRVNMTMIADHLNAEKGITKAQRNAMELGSMFGWEAPGANPDSYNEDGTLKREKKQVA